MFAKRYFVLLGPLLLAIAGFWVSGVPSMSIVAALFLAYATFVKIRATRS
jgi:hypothetical protein